MLFLSMVRTARWVLVFASSACLPVHAQNSIPPETLPPIIVTATRTPTAINAQTRDVTIVSAADIRASAATSLADLLSAIAGVEAVTYGNAGATSGVFLRGANTNQTLVLIDGQRLTSSTSGLTALEAVPLASIERIEIVRGAMSSLYGADALGGVIHIFTKSKNGVSAALSAGSNASAKGDVNAGIVSGAWSANLSASHAQSEGFNAIVNPKNFSYNPDRDGYTQSGATLRVGYEFAPQVVANARLLHNALNTRYDGSATFDDRTRTTQTAWQIGLEARSASLRIGQAEDRARFASEYPGEYRTRTSEASAQQSLKLAHNLSGLAAIEYRREAVASTDAFEKTSRRTVSGIAQMSAELAPALFNATLRIDDSDQFGARLNGSLGAGLQIAPQVRVFANVGTAFKAPTFNDLYYPGYSNPALKAERNVSGDFGARFSEGALQLSATAHASRVRDLIVFQCDADFNCAPQNVSTAKLLGLTLETQIALSRATQLRASLDALSAKDVATNLELPRRSKLHGAVGLAHSIAAWTLRAELIASAARFDDAENKVRMGGYAKLNLSADWRVLPSLTLEARLRNALDARYELAHDFAVPGRELFVGLRWAAQ